MALQKKIREIFNKIDGEVKDQEFRVWSDLDYIDGSDAVVAISTVKKEILEEIGKVAQQIHSDEDRAKKSGWNKSFLHGYLKAKEEDLGLLVEPSRKGEK